MTMVIEKKLKNFHFWDGAAINAAKLKPEELDAIEQQMEQMAEGADEWTVTAVNDYFWFEFEQVCKLIDLNYEEVMARV